MRDRSTGPRRRPLRSLALALGAAGCVATPLASELDRAQVLEAKHEDTQAVELYDALLWTCEHGTVRKRDDCGEGAVRKALLVERRDNKAALAAWLAAYQIAGSKAKRARALVRAATISEELGDAAGAEKLAWQAVEEFPDEMPADDALRLAVRLGDERDAAATVTRLGQLFERFAKEEIGDNLLFWREELYREHERLSEAVTLADELWTHYRRSSLRDDAMWNVARAQYAAGQSQLALQRLQTMIDTRRDALLTGSYNSEFLDDARYLQGQIALDGLHDPAMAIHYFSDLVGDWPESILRDDALMEWARALLSRHTPPNADDVREACAVLARIAREFPDGNQVNASHKRQRELGCAP